MSDHSVYIEGFCHTSQITYSKQVEQYNITSKLTYDEEISPTVEQLAVLRWLELIDSRLPMLVARTIATDLQTRTL